MNFNITLSESDTNLDNIDFNITFSEGDLSLGSAFSGANSFYIDTPPATDIIANVVLKPFMKSGDKSEYQIYNHAAKKGINRARVSNALHEMANRGDITSQEGLGTTLIVSLNEGASNE